MEKLDGINYELSVKENLRRGWFRVINRVGLPPLTRERLRRTMEAVEQHLDFLMIAYYPFEWYYQRGFLIERREVSYLAEQVER